jgi:hypothetical protein
MPSSISRISGLLKAHDQRTKGLPLPELDRDTQGAAAHLLDRSRVVVRVTKGHRKLPAVCRPVILYSLHPPGDDQPTWDARVIRRVMLVVPNAAHGLGAKLKVEVEQLACNKTRRRDRDLRTCLRSKTFLLSVYFPNRPSSM